jgi:hypothetical protein
MQTTTWFELEYTNEHIDTWEYMYASENAPRAPDDGGLGSRAMNGPTGTKWPQYDNASCEV